MNLHVAKPLGGGLALTVFAALLAACSGQSQGSPAGVPAREPQAGIEATNLRAPSQGFQKTGNQCISSQGAYLFANDYKTGNVDEYCEDGAFAKPHHNTLFAFCAGCGGWGLAVSPTAAQTLAIGTNLGTVTLWNVAANGTVAPQNSPPLTLDGGTGTNFPSGICFDGTGGLYATNYNTNIIDYFSAATLGTGGGPTGSWTTTTVTIPYFLACDFDGPTGENYLMVSGELLKNSVFNFVLTQVVNGLPPVGNHAIADVVVHNFGPSPNALAGGLTLDKQDNLIVADENGTLYKMGTSEPWANILAKCTDLAFISGISFDETQDEVWSSNDVAAPATKVISNQFPFPRVGKCKPGTSRGPAVPSMGEKEYIGIAVWPNTGV
jgi:hypothetical protein